MPIINDVAQPNVTATQTTQASQSNQASKSNQSTQSVQAAVTASATAAQIQQAASTIKTDTGNKSSADGRNPQQEARQDALVKAVEKAIVADGGGSVDLQFKELRFSFHEDTQRMMVKVVDQNTDEIIREIPSKEVLDMLAVMWDSAGLFIDEQR